MARPPKGSATKNRGRGRVKGSKSKSGLKRKSPTKEKRAFRFHPGTVALREIKRYQKTSKPLTARLPFERRIRNTLAKLDPEIRLKNSTIECMREATEAFLTELLHDANLCAIHAMRSTVKEKDLLLASRIRGDDSRAYF